MVHFHRPHQMKKAAAEQPVKQSQALELLLCQNLAYYKRRRLNLICLLFLSTLSCLLILFSSSSFTSIFTSLDVANGSSLPGMEANGSVCSPVTLGTLCCDRSAFRSDICFMKGDIRTNQASSSVFLYVSWNNSDLTNYALEDAEDTEEVQDVEIQHEKIKPYTRKWETSVMDTIDELNLISFKAKSGNQVECDVKHDVPAVFFSTGGYTGNVYHEFNDGIIPLYITSQHFQKKVVFVILEYHNWWINKYGDILSRLSDYPAIDFSGDKRIHCFPQAIAGLKIHDELTVEPSLMAGNKSIVDFRDALDRAYWPRIKGLIQDEEILAQAIRQNQSSGTPSSETPSFISETQQEDQFKKPKLTIMSRGGSRAITNEDLLVTLAEEIGFQVDVLRPDKTTELAKIYRALNSSDAMIGVHGAAMTHFLFLRPGSVFIQVIPLGTAWAAETYYGEPAKKLGLKYTGYEIQPRESSLFYRYDKKDPVLQNPTSITTKGWQYTKEIYLDGQNVTLDLNRFYKRLVRSYHYSLPRNGQLLPPPLR